MPAADTILPRVFIACAPQDVKYAELITAKALGDRLPVTFAGFGEGKVDEISWQRECRRRIRSSRVLVVLVSPHSRGSRRALWQVACARELGVPIMGIMVGFGPEADGAHGAVVDKASIVGWKWKTIAATLMRFASKPVPASGAAMDAVAMSEPVERASGLGSRSSAA